MRAARCSSCSPLRHCCSVQRPLFSFPHPLLDQVLELHACTEAPVAARLLSARVLVLRPRRARLAEAFLLGVSAANGLWSYHVQSALDVAHLAHRYSPVTTCTRRIYCLQLSGGAAVCSQLDAPG